MILNTTIVYIKSRTLSVYLILSLSCSVRLTKSLSKNLLSYAFRSDFRHFRMILCSVVCFSFFSHSVRPVGYSLPWFLFLPLCPFIRSIAFLNSLDAFYLVYLFNDGDDMYANSHELSVLKLFSTEIFNWLFKRWKI